MRRLSLWIGLVLAAGLAASRAAAPQLLAPGADLDEVIHANNRGAAFMEQFRHAQALEEFSKVTAKAPGWAPGFVNLGLAAFYARESERAGIAFREAVRIDPGLVQAQYGLGLLLKNEGKTDEALAPFEKARAIDPEDADILYNLGLLEARRRQFQEASTLLRRARQIDPNSVSIRYQLARALLQAGQSAEGQKEMAAYQKLAANPRFAVPTGNQYGEAGRYALVIIDYAGLGGPPPPARPIAVRFSEATDASGILFTHAGPGGDAWAPATAKIDGAGGRAARFGSGVAVGDLDGDGLPDLVFANADAQGTARPVIARNKGHWSFEEVGEASGVSFKGIGMGAALGDFDNDGDLDLYLTRLGGGALFENQGNGTFKEITARAGAVVTGFVLGASWVDLDHDGDLDLFLCRMPAPGSKGP
ncbi:MAG TPA: FG-GAP-like repeat-containing protein, partial [Candidatus Polarisedimenticolia bacterium]|nr:FG-GAP-like repeat-containing protein [Candidatus Polarisedimenticolia bacterium]